MTIVLKTISCNRRGGSNPSPSANLNMYNVKTMKTMKKTNLFPNGELFTIQLTGHMKIGECVYESSIGGDIDVGVVIKNSYDEDGKIWADVRVNTDSDTYKNLMGCQLFSIKQRKMKEIATFIEPEPIWELNILGVEL